MESISRYLGDDHRRCDALFAAAEAAIMQNAWTAASQHFHAFRTALTRHIGMEEQVLFPALESHTGTTMGPTRVMRMEHRQMEELFQALENAIRRQSRSPALSNAAALQTILQQHNVKEEQILYPMADQILPEWEVIVAEMACFDPEERL